jgi:hemerythrin-like domain-containing protein
MVPSRRRAAADIVLAAVEPIDPALIDEPIEFLFAEHYRQRALLNHLDWIAREASGEACVKVVRMALDFLRHDLPNHVADEEEDLFPLLRSRCTPEDQVDAIFDVLAAEHAADETLVRTVIERLETIAASPNGLVDPALRVPIRAFVETQRRHLSWENALVLPLARRRLNSADLHKLSEGMARRRGIPRPTVSAPSVPPMECA